MTERYEPFRTIASNAAVDAIALVPGANFSRLYGKTFHQNERPLVVIIPTEGLPAAVVPNLELESFATLGFEGEVFDWRDQTGYQSAFDALIQHLSIDSVGVEGQVMRVFVDQAFRQASPTLRIQDLQQSIAALRLQKTAREIADIRHAIAISETALANTIDKVALGMTERQVESILVQELFGNGAEEFAFSPIVAAATNSAQPHAHARGDYQLQAGDALLIDFGARARGVCADITRTFFVGYCRDEHAEIYQTVLAANLAGHAAAKPLATAHDVDHAVMTVLEESSFKSRIRHKTGHGLGRDIHEDPYIMRGNHQALTTGMVFTIEPGLYASNDIGIRIEDDVLITDSGSESMTRFDKSLTLLG